MGINGQVKQNKGSSTIPMLKKLFVISSITLVIALPFLVTVSKKSEAGPIAGAACCAATCAPGGGPISPIYWACLGACVGTVGIVNMFAPGVCSAAFAAPTP